MIAAKHAWSYLDKSRLSLSQNLKLVLYRALFVMDHLLIQIGSA